MKLAVTARPVQSVSFQKPLTVAPVQLWNKILYVAMALGVSMAVLAAGNNYVVAQTPAPARRSEILRSLPITKFYDTPDPLPAGNPGALIRSQEFDGYELPFSVSAVRILYHSRSASAEHVAASGVVLFPYDKKPPAGGWPVIAWAHGSLGVGRACAPSLMRNIGHGPLLAMYVNLGYAVVATDYTGLGTNFRNAFLDGPSNATDVINSIPAARAAVPQLSARWIVMGASGGSLTAGAVAAKENEIRDPNYLGAIAISDVATAKEIYEHSTAGSSSLVPISLAYGIKTVYPQFQVTDMLTEKALAFYRDLDQTCSEPRAITDLSPSQIVKPGWESNTFVRQYFARNDPGEATAYGPILVISSATSTASLATITAQTISRMCKQGDRVQWERYSDLDPGSLIGDSVRDQIGWIAGRFAGRLSPTNCP